VNAISLNESIGPEDAAIVPYVQLLDTGQFESDLPAWYRSAEDELLNTITHGFGFILAVVGAQMLTANLLAQTNRWLVVGGLMYLVSLVGVYAMSALSHGATDLTWKTRFRQLDQGFIYLLIVGTYTPYSLAYLHGPIWMAVLGGMWIVAILGFITKVFLAHRVDSVSIVSYLVLGWIPIVSVPTLLREAPVGAFNLIIGGGVCYTIGVMFLVNDRKKHFHATWHLCVVAGSACHFYGLLGFVVTG
jgi:hemolysin III